MLTPTTHGQTVAVGKWCVRTEGHSRPTITITDMVAHQQFVAHLRRCRCACCVLRRFTTTLCSLHGGISSSDETRDVPHGETSEAFTRMRACMLPCLGTPSGQYPLYYVLYP